MAQILAHEVATAASRASMLRAGKAWQAQGQTNRALDLYIHIVELYPNSEEANEACFRMTAVAGGYERQGCYLLAMGIYQRLETLSS